MRKRTISLLAVVGLLLFALGSTSASARNAGASRTPKGDKNAYTVTNLVSDEPGAALAVDPNLVNPWGLTASATSPWWVADNETDVSTLYDGAGVARSLVVQVEGAPTGAVFNGGTGFVVSDGTNSGAAVFIFDTQAGTIRGWNPNVPPPPPSTQSHVLADRSDVEAIYTGLAIASTAAGNFLYAADFHNARVDMFDGAMTLVSTSSTFVDPGLPAGYAPFGIQNIGGRIFVAYAKQDADGEEEVAGKGLGVVDMFDTAGAFLGRVASGGALNAPWGLAMAPATGFGRFSGDLLVGNFGDGSINAYEPKPNGVFGQRRSPAIGERPADPDRRALGARVRQRRRRGADDLAVLHRRARRGDARAVREDRARELTGRTRGRSGTGAARQAPVLLPDPGAPSVLRRVSNGPSRRVQPK